MTTMGADEAKLALRRELRARRRRRSTTTSAGERRRVAGRLADALEERLVAMPGGRPRCVAVFESLPTEPPTDAIVERLHAAGTEVLVPILLEDRDLDWARLRPDGGRDAPLGSEGIGRAALVVAPAIAVDDAGRRLGQGGGSYDRALPRRAAGTPVVAVVFDDEHVGRALPVEDHDQRVDAVLTPSSGWTDLDADRGGDPTR